MMILIGEDQTLTMDSPKIKVRLLIIELKTLIQLTQMKMLPISKWSEIVYLQGMSMMPAKIQARIMKKRKVIKSWIVCSNILREINQNMSNSYLHNVERMMKTWLITYQFSKDWLTRLIWLRKEPPDRSLLKTLKIQMRLIRMNSF